MQIEPQPGEISLAHNGVLIPEELLERPRSALNRLRDAMERLNMSARAGYLTM